MSLRIKSKTRWGRGHGPREGRDLRRGLRLGRGPCALRRTSVRHSGRFTSPRSSQKHVPRYSYRSPDPLPPTAGDVWSWHLGCGPSPVAAGAAATARRARNPHRPHRRPRSGSHLRSPRPRVPAAETRVSRGPSPCPHPLAWTKPQSHLPLGFRLLHRRPHSCAEPGQETTPHLSSNQIGKICRGRLATA